MHCVPGCAEEEGGQGGDEQGGPCSRPAGDGPAAGPMQAPLCVRSPAQVPLVH